MRKFTANYSNTNHNFVIQNLLGNKIENEYLPAICIIKNIIQRGCPTIASKFIQSKLGKVDFTRSFPLISTIKPKWERIIRGDRKNNYNPAQKFFDQIIPRNFPEFPFFQQLLIPEVPINEITQIEVLEFAQQQVDFYFPQAFLVIEIDGSQHDAVADNNRDSHLAKFGIKTVRITTSELESESDSFKTKLSHIKERITQISKLQEEKKKKQPELFSFNDYKNAMSTIADLNSSVYLATSIIRFQVLILELLEKGKLTFADNWDFSILCNDQKTFEEIACEDLLQWFDNLFRLQRISFAKPKVKFTRVKSFEALQSSETQIKIDFSLTKRYTDEFQNHSEIIFVRTAYLEYYRYYKNTNAISPEYVDLEPYNYFQISTAELVNYKIQVGGKWNPEAALSFFLDNIFGYDTFYPGQLPIIISSLGRNDTIGLLPTGGGKSVCYQLAAVLQPAISFVVCPIKSLMYDQKQDLDSIYFTRVNHITSDDDGEDKEKIMKEFALGKFFFIFISPERFQIKNFRQYLLSVNQNHKIAFAVIDEVHCMSEWGHDFRTSYLNLSKTIQRHCNDFRFIGLTATASINVLKDIQLEFGIKQENIKTLTDYTRKELSFEIINDRGNKIREIKTFLHKLNDNENVLTPQDNASKCGIIFTPHVNGAKGCYKLALTLEQEFRTPVKYYSGQVPSLNQQPIMNVTAFEDYKKQVQIEFKKNEFTLLAATKAFGMGVNKPNIHYTIHFGIPGSMESLYQEAGRAGRDKVKFTDEDARCLVLFTKTSEEDLLQKIWDRETTLSKLVETLPQIDGDINTNLFLFKMGLDVIKDEYELIAKFISQYAVPSQKSVKVYARNLGSSKFKTEKTIYRLTQLGIVDDWTVTNFFTGEFEVNFSNFTEATLKTNLKSTINKYDKEFDFDSLEDNGAYQQYHKIWVKEASVKDKCIVLLLQWAYDHFAYNRRQSLKNIYENCDDYISERITQEEFKQRLENYFKFSEASYLLQHIAENPNDFYRWFEVFYQVDNNEISNEIINWEQRQSLLANLSRVLESYEYNTGLDFISGMLRLLVDDFGNTDGKGRFESSFKQIMKYQQESFDFVFDKILEIGQVMSSASKNDLALSLLTFFPNNLIILRKIQNRLGDEYTTEILLSGLTTRMTKINQEIYAELIQIR
jgi:ATP-dependent DNA helicase RecQ